MHQIARGEEEEEEKSQFDFLPFREIIIKNQKVRISAALDLYSQSEGPAMNVLLW